MTMLINITPDTEAELIRQAASQGLDVQAYASRVLEVAMRTPAAAGVLDSRQLEATLHEFAQFTRKIPLLSDEAISRDSIYGDHA